MSYKSCLFNKILSLANVTSDKLAGESDSPLENLINHKCDRLKLMARECKIAKADRRVPRITCFTLLAKQNGYIVNWLEPLDDAARYLADLNRKGSSLAPEHFAFIDNLNYEQIASQLSRPDENPKTGLERQTLYRLLNEGTGRCDLIKFKFLYQYVVPNLHGFIDKLHNYVSDNANSTIFWIPEGDPFANEMIELLLQANSSEDLGQHLVKLLNYHDRLDNRARNIKERQSSSPSIATNTPYFHKHAHDYIQTHIPLIKEVILPGDQYAKQMYGIICKTQEQYANLRLSEELSLSIEGNMELIRILLANIHDDECIHSSFHSFIGARA